jgi:hypothetical protein
MLQDMKSPYSPNPATISSAYEHEALAHREDTPSDKRRNGRSRDADGFNVKTSGSLTYDFFSASSVSSLSCGERGARVGRVRGTKRRKFSRTTN